MQAECRRKNAQHCRYYRLYFDFRFEIFQRHFITVRFHPLQNFNEGAEPEVIMRTAPVAHVVVDAENQNTDDNTDNAERFSDGIQLAF